MGREEGLGQSGEGRGSGTGMGVWGAEVRGIGRTERWGSQRNHHHHSHLPTSVENEKLRISCIYVNVFLQNLLSMYHDNPKAAYTATQLQVVILKVLVNLKSLES